ncbi:MAG: MlaE family lipid ABC transporter permease subunit [Hyphomicrobiales bacterium]|nr:MlaE family lipid ABC transporter permease subunit [Hyphomicrobiales bacterium]
MTAGTLLSGQVTAGGLGLAASGAWTAEHARTLEPLVEHATRTDATVQRIIIDVTRIERLDTYGAWLIERTLRVWTSRGCDTRIVGLSDSYGNLFKKVRAGAGKLTPLPRRSNSITATLESVGRTMSAVFADIMLFSQMAGALVIAFLRVVAHPTKFRLTSMVNHLERVGWHAVPIILLITFLIGSILAQQGIFHFRTFGADIYVVDMVGVLVLREVGVLIVCIMVAGRSGSAYTAELGSMKMREEVDALRTMGFDPVEVLILPRIFALIITVPILTFLGSMAALYGGGIVAWLYGGIDPQVFLARLHESISVKSFAVGMIKAPFMAIVIGLVACVEGLQVKGSAESLGAKTTDSVVKSIFLVIVLDGAFAIFFASIGV